MNPQRSYRAICPQCGAQVEFRSAASALAVCSFCGSTLLRDGESLRRIGQMAELFDDHSPIRIGSSGRLPAELSSFFLQPDGPAFTVVGRLQWRYPDGRWSEWSLLFDDGSTLWLSEDNGRYALSREMGAEAGAAPEFARLGDGTLTPGRLLNVGGRAFEITNLVRVEIQAAQGELPAAALASARAATIDQPPATHQAGPEGPTDAEPASAPPLPSPSAGRAQHWILEGRSTTGIILSVDYADPARPSLAMGRAVELSQLQWRDLADESSRDLGTRAFACPACGAPVEVHLTGSLTIVCAACSSVIDLSARAAAQGIPPRDSGPRGPGKSGGEAGEPAGVPPAGSPTAAEDLGYFRQQRRFTPTIPLGSRGRLFDVEWQAVGFARRSGRSADGFDFTWRETLLWHATEGFAFVVVASDGLSFVRTIQDSPEMLGRRGARYQGRVYRAEEPYAARVDYVEGEFYWRVRRDQVTENIDFINGDRLLSRELERFAPEAGRAGEARAPAPAGGEVVWSAGQRISRSTLLQAFSLPADALSIRDRPSLIPGAGVAAEADADGLVDAPAYDPNDMPRGLGPGTAGAARTAAAAGGAAAGAGGAGPVTGSLGMVGLIVVVLIILVIVFLLVNSGGGGGGGGWSSGGGGGYSGSHK